MHESKKSNQEAPQMHPSPFLVPMHGYYHRTAGSFVSEGDLMEPSSLTRNLLKCQKNLNAACQQLHVTFNTHDLT